MAEAEIKKHTSKIITLFQSKSHSSWHKLKEFGIEIITIVFAVSLSIWFHERSEHSHQVDEANEFLLGLSEDLRNDLKEINQDKQMYEGQRRLFLYVYKLKPDQRVDQDTIKKYSNALFNYIRLLQNNGRFEGFKSSGKIGYIEDKKLQNEIMDFYQEHVPQLLFTIDLYNSKKDQLENLVEKNYSNSEAIGFSPAFNMGESRIICALLLGLSGQIIDQYELCRKKAEGIVSEINKTHSFE